MRTTWFLLPAGEKGENRRKTGGDPFTGTRRQNVGLCLYGEGWGLFMARLLLGE